MVMHFFKYNIIKVAFSSSLFSKLCFFYLPHLQFKTFGLGIFLARLNLYRSFPPLSLSVCLFLVSLCLSLSGLSLSLTLCIWARFEQSFISDRLCEWAN